MQPEINRPLRGRRISWEYLIERRREFYSDNPSLKPAIDNWTVAPACRPTVLEERQEPAVRTTPPRRRIVAASDNKPQDNLAARRACLDSLPTTYEPVLAWPTAERLTRLESPNAAQALVQYAELMSPPRIVAANDNDAPDEDPDFIHEIRPSEAELMRAAGPALRVVYSKTANGWSVLKRTYPPLQRTKEGLRLGSLLFHGGKLVQFGTTARGKPLKPIERQRNPRGGSLPARLKSDIRFLVANDNVPIAKGARFLAGIKGRKGTTTRPDIGEYHAAEELARNQRRAAVRLALGAHAGIMDLAITDSTAKEVGETLGFEGKTAERRGIAAINAAIEEFQKIAGCCP